MIHHIYLNYFLWKQLYQFEREVCIDWLIGYFSRKYILKLSNNCTERFVHEVSKKKKRKLNFIIGINPFHATVSFYTTIYQNQKTRKLEVFYHFQWVQKETNGMNGLRLTLPNDYLRFEGWFLQSPVSCKTLLKSLTKTLKSTGNFLKMQSYINNEMNSFLCIFQEFQYLNIFILCIENHVYHCTNETKTSQKNIYSVK